MTGSNQELLLQAIGRRVRQLRDERRMTAPEVAAAADLSLRFYRDLENGRANISVGRLAQVAAALDVPLNRLVDSDRVASPRLMAIERRLRRVGREERERILSAIEGLVGGSTPRVIALLGLRGAGKSTVGPLLAARLNIDFVEVDGLIEDAAGLGLAEIFALHGEGYYRRLETRCLVEQIGRAEPAVLALSGGVVSNPAAFELVSSQCTTVWLRASPEDHMNRVIEQGDFRPMEDRDDAMAELRDLLAAREPFYRQARLTVDTSAHGVEGVVDRILDALV